MRLRKFTVKNFKGLKDVSFEWDRFVVLIGENNTGKSSVLQALDWFLSGSAIKDEDLCHNHVATKDDPIELIGYFADLSDFERAAPAVAGRIVGDEWILKKTFWCDENEVWKEMYYSMARPEHFVGWPNSTGSWNAFPEDYLQFVDQLEDGGPRPNKTNLEQLKAIVRQHRPDLVEQLEPAWIPNPGGGGNWKSNANSLLPHGIFIHAVHDASAEATSKDASSYGKIIGLLVEKKMMGKPEIQQLRQDFAAVLKLFNPDPAHPELQAPEIKDIQEKINAHLNRVVAGLVRITTEEPDIQPLLLPNTTLMMKAEGSTIETTVEHQGHGLQRTLIIALLQVLVAIQREAEGGERVRSTIFMIEEPELYLHPQMERKMRDTLYGVAAQDNTQVIACTHSPVFLDMGQRHKSIVRVVKEGAAIRFRQVLVDLFDEADGATARERLVFLSEFHSGVNEVFFARRVVLVEGPTEIAVFEYAPQQTGLFDRHPSARRDVTIIDCEGKGNFPLFQKVLNHFSIPYLAVYDEDTGADAQHDNERIDNLAGAGGAGNATFRITPRDLETMLGYGGGGKSKPYRAIKRIRERCEANNVPADFTRLLNQVYFGEDAEPSV